MQKTYLFCLILILGVYAIDCLGLTPFAIQEYGAKEVGVGCALLYNYFGIYGFYIMFALFSMFLIIGFFYLEKIKKYQEDIKIAMVVGAIFFSGMMLNTIFHNLKVIGVMP